MGYAELTGFGAGSFADPRLVIPSFASAHAQASGHARSRTVTFDTRGRRGEAPQTMAVLTCAHCGAPREPSYPRCPFCGVHFADPVTGTFVATVSSKVEAALRSGKKIEAIKLYRLEHRTGLKEAKEAVEALQKRLGL